MNSYINLGTFFYDIAEQNAKNPLLVYEGTIVTYKQVNELSNQIARYFLSIGISFNDVVAIFNTKKTIGYASMLACLKIGAIYTNLDDETPPERLKKILNNCSPKLIVSDKTMDSSICETINDLNIQFIDLSRHQQYQSLNCNNLEETAKVIGSTPAYIMFTSGSTGIPKGVTISHANILSFLTWSIQRYKITSSDRFAQVSPMYFDNSVFDFYTAFFSGASIVPLDKEITKQPLELISLVDKLQCTIWFSVPSLLVYLLTMRTLTKENMLYIRIFTFGGEGFPKNQLKKLYDLYGDRAKLINVYGPTEGTCICSSYDISVNDFDEMSGLASLGTINPNFEYIIVDNEMKQVDQGEKGELCLIGPNIALGYYNDIERTQKSFIQNPLTQAYYNIIYKTGDIVYEENSLLWFAGRVDNQIKHMGYRIELEEIESALNGLESVSQAGVVYHRVRENYGKIIAFVSVKIDIEEKELLSELKRYLPEYMLPNQVNFMDHLPKNQNGKVDRKVLQSMV